MKSVVIMTATYNHPKELEKLFQSLLVQENKDFTWIVINDGSRDDTRNVLKDLARKSNFDMIIVDQENGGKSSAINTGLNMLSEEVEFVVIVDDDEILFTSAIEKVHEYVSKYRGTNCGVIHFNRLNEQNEIIARPIIDQDMMMSYQSFKSEGRHADGYIGYFTEKLGEKRFSIYSGEKYIAPSTLFMKVTEDSELLWAKEVLGQTEYLAGGITRQGKSLRIRNPLGMIEYCEEMLNNESGFKTKQIYSIQGYAYYFFLEPNLRNKKLKLIRAAKPLGYIVYLIWKKKYA